MTERERLIACMTFRPCDHLDFQHSYGLMPGTLERWHREGLPAELDEESLREYFGFATRPPRLPIDLGLFPAFEPVTIEETNEHVIQRDAAGTVRMLKKGVATIAIPREFPIKSRSDWEEHYKWRLRYHPDRLGEGWLGRYHELREEGLPVGMAATGLYWFPRDLMGDEGLCLAYYTQPDLVHDILRTYVDMICAVSEQLLSKIQVDSFHMGEDMCYRNAMMISPATFREFMMPHYRRIIDLYRSHGTRIFSIDTDGNLTTLIPLLIEAGVNVVTPCEVRAGNDVVALRRQYGKSMAFTRGINKLALADAPTSLVPGSSGSSDPIEAIEEELAYRLPPMIATGGYAAGLDHRVVPQTSLKSFTHYVRRVREYLGLDLDVRALQNSLTGSRPMSGRTRRAHARTFGGWWGGCPVSSLVFATIQWM